MQNVSPALDSLVNAKIGKYNGWSSIEAVRSVNVNSFILFVHKTMEVLACGENSLFVIVIAVFARIVHASFDAVRLVEFNLL